MKRNINQYTAHRLRNDPKDRFIDENIKTFIVTLFHVFKKVEEGINVLSRDMEDILKLNSWRRKTRNVK